MLPFLLQHRVFATIPTGNAFADASVARVSLLTALKLLRSCYCNCYVAIATATSSFVAIATMIALSLLRVAGDTATLPMLLPTSFAAVATALAYADASVARVSLLTALKLLRSCYCNCYLAIATATSSFAKIATTNAISLLRVPGDTATLPLLLLTSFGAVATAFAYADNSVARVCLLYTSPSPRD